ncbi:uncharacterized protein LOC126836015 [Adelges cooleyi]|uniref:uncharacterized protein LOC126836015 n=1 Tax=Adelges cooleyi TaxID=133065 RepID=UPI00217F4A14|nr:uncharacterized protein LOC126836015 [Adelges cooleyi]
MVTSRLALEGILQNGLADLCKATSRMSANTEDLFHLYNIKQNMDDTASERRCYSPTETIKRETHTPTNSSEDSGVDVGPCKRKRTKDACPTSAKRQDAILSVNCIIDVPDKIGHGCPPFRPWSNESSSASDVGLRLFHDIQNVDRILTLTQRRDSQPPEPQPLDLTRSTGRLTVARTAVYRTNDDEQFAPSTKASFVTSATPATAVITSTNTATTTTRHGKSMSRARRIEANARERSRVHTISAAFDTLRSSIPSYSKTQKLSKLSTIRIASAYILTLSRLLDMDYTAEQSRPSVEQCVNDITGIIHMEGKARKRKDDP